MSNLFDSEAQGKQIQLLKGSGEAITYKDLTIRTLFQIYDSAAAVQVLGTTYLRVYDNQTVAAEFYNVQDSTSRRYHTKAYKNYFLTFKTKAGQYYLNITQAHFGKAFALSNLQKVILHTKTDTIALEIVDVMEEYGWDAPPEIDDRTYFSHVAYTLKATSNKASKYFIVYSSDITNGLTLTFDTYTITLLSDQYKNASSVIEMVVRKI